MYIEEIILEGFKSYATRTSISGWDPEFNAITGLNGTGKSNILDAICFVLGIDNLKQVRAVSLQDLVYKKGQAGITKAAVTIVFNNTDPAKSPIGFADCPQVTVTRQIVLNGKNKYLINGHNAQQKAVENLFQSVQLNVNNPHFLIMQGQITRVINMKPMETLALIEESAGTRMFEDRKTKAIGTLEKKERKVEEMSTLLSDTIEPKLNALKSERAEFLEYKRTESELERLQRLLKAFEYTKDTKTLEDEEARLREVREQLSSLVQQNKSDKLELEAIKDEIFGLTKRREQQLKSNNKWRELEMSCKEANSRMVKVQIQIDVKKEILVSEETSLIALQTELTAERKKLSKLEVSLSKVKTKYTESEETHGKLINDLRRNEDLLRSLETGLTGDDSRETGYAKLLKEARDKLSCGQTAMYHAQQRVKSLRNEIVDMERDIKTAHKEGEKIVKQINDLESEVSLLKDKLGERPDFSDALYKEREALNGTIIKLEKEMEEVKTTIGGVEFRYNILDRKFDHNAIKGTIAKLVQLPKEHLKHSIGLEVAAGGRLYNIVVENENTAAILLEHGKLIRRITFIPLNKIQSRVVPSSMVSLAKELTHGNAHLGLSLIEYDQEISKAMEYVFGNTFICETKEAAALVAFDKRLGFRAVTIEGDVYEPYGTLSGGSTSSVVGILSKLHQNVQLIEETRIIRDRLEHINNEITSFENHRRQFLQMEKDLQTKEQHLLALKRQFALSRTGQLLEKYNSAKDQLTSAMEDVSQQERAIKDAQVDCEHYGKEHSELTLNRDGKLSSIREQIQVGRSTLAKDDGNYRTISEEFHKLQNEQDASNNFIEDLNQRIISLQSKIEIVAGEIDVLSSEHLQIMTQHNGLRIKLDTETQNLRQFDAELVTLEDKAKRLKEAVESFSLQKKQLDDAAILAEKSLKHIGERLNDLLTANPWIEDVSSEFGKEDGQFDFRCHNMGEIATRFRSLESKNDRLRTTINFNVIDMLDRVEARDNALRQMLNTVKRDKTKIEGTISKLNDYMLDTLNRTWKKVSMDFGQIFGELLPGSTAKLNLIEGEPITSGLEIKVCLGGVWKQSLTELSGGQRSLVALSLILALLQYRPAPMYILDEVDAALDLSHTENIGRLLKNRFKGSQFVIVSLKEGMFANANILFRTRFCDGVSSVERVVNTETKRTSTNVAKKTSLKLGSKSTKVEPGT